MCHATTLQLLGDGPLLIQSYAADPFTLPTLFRFMTFTLQTLLHCKSLMLLPDTAHSSDNDVSSRHQTDEGECFRRQAGRG